jgi:transposase
LDVTPAQVASLNDDRVGRCLDRLFDADCPGLVLAITRHVVEEFGLDLSELHNDSTTITFYGAYDEAGRDSRARGKTTPAITWGYNKDHKPHLKQLLYNLTVTADGGVPVVFGVENGNVTDDQTHQENWNLLCVIVGGPEFIYVADSKLATRANMSHIASRGGSFISVLPRSRKEDEEFRQRVADGLVTWETIDRKYDDHGQLVDTISIAAEEETTDDGFRLVWIHSTRKVELDRIARGNRIGRASRNLNALRAKLSSPRTRYREEAQVAKAVAKCLSLGKAADLIDVQVLPVEREVFVQETRGRPGANTRYRREVKLRFDIAFAENREKIAEAEKQDGVFPLVTNRRDLSARDVLAIYKRQAQIEKRFSQLKTQFAVAPVFLKSVHRVVALLTVYYLTLLVQALVEREARLTMERQHLESLPLYPEERKCKAPTTRRIIDLFENVQRHELRSPGTASPALFATELSKQQAQVLRLLGVPETDYRV